MTGTAERLQLTGMRLREQRADMRAGRADRRTERLRHRVDVLQTELDREREAREELMEIVRHEGGHGTARRAAERSPFSPWAGWRTCWARRPAVHVTSRSRRGPVACASEGCRPWSR